MREPQQLQPLSQAQTGTVVFIIVYLQGGGVSRRKGTARAIAVSSHGRIRHLHESKYEAEDGQVTCRRRDACLRCSSTIFIIFVLALFFLGSMCQQVTRHASRMASMEDRTSCHRFTALLNSAMNSDTLPAAMQEVRMFVSVARDSGVESPL